VCLEPPDDAVVTQCGHTFCRECILGCMGRSGAALCPLCRETVTREGLLTLPRANRFEVDLEKQWRSSAKVDALLEELRRLMDGGGEPKGAAPTAAAAGDPPDADGVDDDASVDAPPRSSVAPIKSVVFSQWSGMLDIVEVAMKREPRLSGSYCRLDGAMSSDERQRALRRFRDERGTRVLLISLKAGGVGLNLTSARRVFLLDPWFNPAVEEQAMDRVHRLGQEHPVIVTRFIVKGTVEERMLELQERKRALCQAALGGDNDGEAAAGEFHMPASAAARRASKEEARRLRLRDLALCFE
jgi:DNA repair protein RAD5